MSHTQLVICWYNVAGYYPKIRPKRKRLIPQKASIEGSEEDRPALEILSQDIIFFSGKPLHGVREETLLRPVYRDARSDHSREISLLSYPHSSTVHKIPVRRPIPSSRSRPDIYEIPDLLRTYKVRIRRQIQLGMISSSERLSESLECSSVDSGDLQYHNISLCSRISSVVSSLSSGCARTSMGPSYKLNLLSKEVAKLVPDMEDKVSYKTLMAYFMAERYMGTHLVSKKELQDRPVYEAVIKKNRTLYNMLRSKRNMLPDNLLDVLNQYQRMHKTFDRTNKSKESSHDQDLFFYTSLSMNFKSLINELAMDLNSVQFFQLNLFQLVFERVESLPGLADLFKSEEDNGVPNSRAEIARLGQELRTNHQNPVSHARYHAMQIMATCDLCTSLASLLSSMCTQWLSPLMHGLFSNIFSVRSETCIALSFMFYNSSISSEILHNCSFDIAYDTTIAVYRAIDMFPDSIDSYYMLLGFVLEKAVNYELLDVLIDKGPLLKHKLMVKLWPKLIYYAIKYWPHKSVSEQPIYLRKIVDTLQDYMLHKSYKRNAKLTLMYVCRTYKMNSILCTVWMGDHDKDDNKFK